MNEKLMDCFVNPIKCKLLLEIFSNNRTTAKQLGENFKIYQKQHFIVTLIKCLKMIL